MQSTYIDKEIIIKIENISLNKHMRAYWSLNKDLKKKKLNKEMFD